MSKNGGPAFPVEAGKWAEGMTLRDYFAARAMDHVIGSCDLTDLMQNKELAEFVAGSCYTIADAMLKAREQQ